MAHDPASIAHSNAGIEAPRPEVVSAALATFKAEAPVCCCHARPCRLEADMCGPQRKTLRAFRTLRAGGFEFPAGMSAALSHAFTGEGRGEFDALWAADAH